MSVYSNRAKDLTQNCYIFNDNGVVKMHLEVSFTANGSLSSGGTVLVGMIPINPSDMSVGYTPDSGYTSVKWLVRGASAGTSVNIAPMGTIPSGQRIVFNQDIVCDWDATN